MSITETKEYGFTLLEIIVTLGIVMLLAAFAVPSFIPLRDQAMAIAGTTGDVVQLAELLIPLVEGLN